MACHASQHAIIKSEDAETNQADKTDDEQQSQDNYRTPKAAMLTARQVTRSPKQFIV
ncbi:MAG: hypothetical protein JO108_34245 [Acidobacteriaceae bacterium]|nr:hypothetical protein [Acidobacteriaceae bacterium]